MEICNSVVKICKVCNHEKPLEFFQRRSASKDGYTHMCKPCKRDYDNAHYKNTPSRKDYIRKNSDERIKSVQLWLLEYFSTHPCVDCGESDILVLEFDHRSDKLGNVSDLRKNGNIASVKSEVEKCDVRCCNCHRRKTARTLGSSALSSQITTHQRHVLIILVLAGVLTVPLMKTQNLIVLILQSIRMNRFGRGTNTAGSLRLRMNAKCYAAYAIVVRKACGKSLDKKMTGGTSK